MSPASAQAPPPRVWRLPWRTFAAHCATALAVRLCLLGVDPRMRFFLGDSGSYLATSLQGWIPPDRSWAYGLGMNALMRLTHRLGIIALVQTVAVAVMCASVATLCRALGARGSVAWAVLALSCADPLLLWYERSVMTDAPGTAVAWLGVVAAILWARPRARWGWCVAAVGFFTLALALRTAFVPIALSASVLACALRAWRAWRGALARRARLLDAAASGVLPVAFMLLLSGYARLTGMLTHSPPSLNPQAGALLLGTVAPILQPEDFEGLDAPAALFHEGPDTTERTLRNCQVFCDDGLYPRLLHVEGEDWHRAVAVANTASRHAILRDPWGFAGLWVQNARDYFLPSALRERFTSTYGLNRPLPEGLIAHVREETRDELAADAPGAASPVLEWLSATWFWPLVLCAGATLAPLLSLAWARRMEEGGAVLLLALTSSAYLASVFMFSLEVTPRFLLPTAPCVAVLSALLLEQGLGWLHASARRPPEQAGRKALELQSEARRPE